MQRLVLLVFFLILFCCSTNAQYRDKTYGVIRGYAGPATIPGGNPLRNYNSNRTTTTTTTPSRQSTTSEYPSSRSNSEDNIVKKNKTIVFSNGDRYKGDVLDGVMSGKGTYTFKNGDIYKGDFLNDLFEGKGIYKWTNGTTYDGDFIAGKREGEGSFYENMKLVYKGHWKNDLYDGEGKYDYDDESYDGKWKEGKHDGQGKFTTKEYVLNGNFENNLPEGHGQLFFTNGDWFTGTFKAGLREGYGFYKNADGRSFEGEYQNNKPNGLGTITNKDGSFFIGVLKDSIKNGYGTFYSKAGTVLKQGLWVKGKLATPTSKTNAKVKELYNLKMDLSGSPKNQEKIDNQNTPKVEKKATHKYELVDGLGSSKWRKIFAASSGYGKKEYVLAIATDGSLWGWGNNENGELGIGNKLSPKNKVCLDPVNKWKTISVQSKKMGVRADGTLWQLSGEMKQVGVDHDWSDVSLSFSSDYFLALKSNGTLWACGSNQYGQLGTGNFESSDHPVQVGTDNQWTKIIVDEGTSLGLKRDGTLWVWGFNYNNQLGIGDNEKNPLPVMAPGQGWVSVSKAKLGPVFGIKNDGTLWAWGSLNTFGELGLGDAKKVFTPQQVSSDNDWSEVFHGTSCTIALKKDGTLWGWGFSPALELTSTPKKIDPSSGWETVLVSSGYILAINKNGKAKLWGEGQDWMKNASSTKALSKK